MRALKLKIASVIVLVLWGLLLLVTLRQKPVVGAQVTTPALPEVAAPFPGDPRLEPIPDHPIDLINFNVLGNGKVLTMRFPPRVNGQTASDGDGHADMYVLFDEVTGLPVNQPPIVEAVPKGAVQGVSDLEARLYSSVWELQAVIVDPTYDPTSPTTRIDSVEKVVGPGASPYVKEILQTNIFLNCPIVPAGTVVDPVPGGPVPNEPRVMPAFFKGQIVYFVPYDMEDGPFNPQIMFDFVDPLGNVLPSPDSPLLVASHTPGDPFYTSIWEIWTVHVPFGFDLTTIKSADDVKNSGFPIQSSGIRLNCPVVAVDNIPLSFEDPFDLLAQVTAAGRGFEGPALPVDVPATMFTKARTHLITEVNFPIAGPAGAGATVASQFPLIDPDGKGNVVPLILRDPFQFRSSGPNTTGDIIRIHQNELDAAYLNNKLPEPIEANFASLISAGLLDPEWAPGGRPYQERLALVGRALFELVWKPEQGANQRDVTRCLACHSTPAAGGAARALYTLGDVGTRIEAAKLNAGSMWGSGSAELLNNQMQARGESNITSAHGSQGSIATIRGDVNNGFFVHTGIQSDELIAGPLVTEAIVNGCDTDANGLISLVEAAACDLDGDGVPNELTVGEVTAVTAFFMSLRAPDQFTDDTNLLSTLGVDTLSVERGRKRFVDSIDLGGAACSSCHTPFRPLSGTEFVLQNPQTGFGLPLQVSHHLATTDDVNRGFASSVGEPGLRLYGDFKQHKLGLKMFCSGSDTAKTAELWDVGSVFPYGRCGDFGSDLNAVILAHEGVSLSSVLVEKEPQVDFISSTQVRMSSQKVRIKNTSTIDIPGSPKPIRVVLVGKLTPGIKAANAAGTAPDGGRRQGAFWHITQSIPAGGSVTLNLQFENPDWALLEYALSILDDIGGSEAAASIHAYKNQLSDGDRSDILNFLRVQLISGKLGEGSGGNQK